MDKLTSWVRSCTPLSNEHVPLKDIVLPRVAPHVLPHERQTLNTGKGDGRLFAKSFFPLLPPDAVLHLLEASLLSLSRN